MRFTLFTFVVPQELRRAPILIYAIQFQPVVVFGTYVVALWVKTGAVL